MPKELNTRQQATLHKIRARPTSSNLRWSDAETLLLALGIELSEGRGSRVRLHYRGLKMVVHRPHPRPEMVKGSVEDLREFLIRAGLTT
jgi:hypothetical protein